MNQTRKVVAYHGWGFHQGCWATWKAHLAQHDMPLTTFDRGYFGASQTPDFTDCQVLMVHSYG